MWPPVALNGQFDEEPVPIIVSFLKTWTRPVFQARAPNRSPGLKVVANDPIPT